MSYYTHLTVVDGPIILELIVRDRSFVVTNAVAENEDIGYFRDWLRRVTDYDPDGAASLRKLIGFLSQVLTENVG